MKYFSLLFLGALTAGVVTYDVSASEALEEITEKAPGSAPDNRGKEAWDTHENPFAPLLSTQKLTPPPGDLKFVFERGIEDLENTKRTWFEYRPPAPNRKGMGTFHKEIPQESLTPSEDKVGSKKKRKPRGKNKFKRTGKGSYWHAFDPYTSRTSPQLVRNGGDFAQNDKESSVCKSEKIVRRKGPNIRNFNLPSLTQSSVVNSEEEAFTSNVEETDWRELLKGLTLTPSSPTRGNQSTCEEDLGQDKENHPN